MCSAGAEVRLAAIAKHQTRMSHLLMPSIDAHASGFHGLHRRLHQVEQEVKVMDHQVQNDANVRRTAGKGAESFALDEPRPEVVLLKLFKSGVEPLDMTDLEHRRMA